MGFDLHMQRIREDGDTLYPRAVAEAIFDRGALRPSGFSYVEYPDGRGEIYGGKDELIDGFMLSHFGGDTIWKRALEIAGISRSVILWPGSPVFAAVTDHGVIADLPLDVRIDLGEIVVVTTVDELWRAISGQE